MNQVSQCFSKKGTLGVFRVGKFFTGQHTLVSHRIFNRPGPRLVDASSALADMAQLFGVLSHKLKGFGFNSQSGHMSELQLQSLVRACVKGNQLMFLSLSPYLPLSLESMSRPSDEDKNN